MYNPSEQRTIYFYTLHPLVAEAARQTYPDQASAVRAVPRSQLTEAIGRVLMVDVCSVSEWREAVTEWRSREGYAAVMAPLEWSFKNKVEALKLGVSGIVFFSADFIAELRQALDQVLRGKLWIPRDTLGAYIQTTNTTWRACNPLTPREEQILNFITEGLSNRQIGDTLRISPRTVKFHVSNVLQKKQVKDRKKLLLMYYRSEAKSDVVSGDLL